MIFLLLFFGSIAALTVWCVYRDRNAWREQSEHSGSRPYSKTMIAYLDAVDWVLGKLKIVFLCALVLAIMVAAGILTIAFPSMMGIILLALLGFMGLAWLIGCFDAFTTAARDVSSWTRRN
jgi:hypothetical protein